MAEDNSGRENISKAVIATIIGFLFLSMVGVLIKLEYKAGASTSWMVFIQFSTCLIISIIISSKKNFRDLKTGKLKFHIIRGVTGVAAFTCFTIAISKIPLVNASLLNNTTPLFIPLFSLILLKNKIDEKLWWGIITGFIGIIFILRPDSNQLLKEGDLFGLVSGIFLAVSYIALKILTRTESFIAILFYYSLIAAVLSFPFALNDWNNPSLTVWVYAILTGICFISYLYLLQYAYRFVEVVRLSPLNYSVIVFTGIFDWLLFNHVPDVYSIIGIILVSAGGIFAIRLHEKDNKELKHHWH